MTGVHRTSNGCGSAYGRRAAAGDGGTHGAARATSYGVTFNTSGRDQFGAPRNGYVQLMLDGGLCFPVAMLAAHPAMPGEQRAPVTGESARIPEAVSAGLS